MRNIGVLTVGLFTLIAAAACVPIAEPGQTITVSTATPQVAATATPAPLRENVALRGFGRVSVKSATAQLAIDGDTNSIWGAEQNAPQWFSVTLDNRYLVDQIEMVITQAPAGPTTHEVWLGSGSGTRALYKRFTEVHTEDSQTLRIAIEPPRSINEVLILTLDSPSWVAWREVRVFGTPSVNSRESVGGLRFRLDKVTDGLELPVQVTHAGDGSGRLFVVEQKGRIRIRDRVAPNNGAAGPGNDTLFLDISDRVSCCAERGLLNVAFPPKYATQRQFYVIYTNTDGNTVISRFTTTGDPDRADPDSEEIVLTIDQPHEYHNGGRMAFGPQDGYLYIGSGDGGFVSDSNNSGQDTGTLLGKILRIDVESGVKPYSIPASNPFTQIDGYRDEIWALGLRNPWGFSFDKHTGDLYIPDVGHIYKEEVNYQPAGSRGGENYGWPFMEGSLCFRDGPLPCNADGVTRPVAEYNSPHGCAIVGGAVYRGSRYSAMQALFVFADFCNGQIWGLTRSDVDPTQNVQDGWQSTLLINAAMPISSIGEDEEGNVYVTGYADGAVYILTASEGSQLDENESDGG